jgi:hypothetical protein
VDRHLLAKRRAFDLKVLTDMRCDTFDFEAYRTSDDLKNRRSPIKDPAAGADVTKYRWIFNIPTHVNERQLLPVTEIGVNTDVGDYPYEKPGVFILSAHMPWSPHFRRGSPVCIGPELWPTNGRIPLGDLAIHVAHLLNWDEVGRGPGYVGWNEEAINYHKSHYGGGPINPDIRYPVRPAWLAGVQPHSAPKFERVKGDDRGTPRPGFRVG